MALQKLAALRKLMAAQPRALAAYIVPTADAHNSEYICETDARREWLSGFTGSAGTAVVTDSQALVWTDGRYYTQFESEVDLSLWTLMKQTLPDTPTMDDWLPKNLQPGSVVGVDPHTIGKDEWTPLHNALAKARMQLVAVENNLVDQVRWDMNQPPPPRPHNPIKCLTTDFTGKPAGSKVAELRQKMQEKKVAALVITALDEVAYALNLRGSDIQYNPVFFSYAVITADAVKLFWGDGNLPQSVTDVLESEGLELEGHPYNDTIPVLKQMAIDLSATGEDVSVWLSSDASEAVHRAASGSEVLRAPLNLISEVSPVALMKLIKNEVELDGFRNCHIRDAVAVVRFFRWLHERVDAGETVTEVQAADKLLEFRKEEKFFMGPSFETIAGAGENGAIIHYSPSRTGDQRDIRPTDMFLLDSGGQYLDGTTDITRTRHMGQPSQSQKEAFTLVLKGQIEIATALFPSGVRGNVLDTLARQHLWARGLDYAHGTGHGVGHFLNVHEGPSGVSWRPYPNDPGLRRNQILSNEPGYYKVGEFGIRHEDLVVTIPVNSESDHPRASTLQGDFDGRGVLGFETITLVPNQRKCMDLRLLTDFELSYINSYHARVLQALAPPLQARGLLLDLAWLQAECAPILR